MREDRVPKAATKEKATPKSKELDGAEQTPLPTEPVHLPGAEEQVYELVDIDQISEHPDNPNNGDVDAIDESIEINGWYGVITAQVSTGYILAGNHRYQAAKRRGATHVPVVWQDVDDVTAIRILLADNEIARHAVINRDQVSRLLDQLGTLDGTGFRGLEDLEADERAREEAEAAEEAAKAAEEVDEPGLYDPADDVYEQQYGVIVVCDSEEDQREKYEHLKEIGWKIRVVAV